MSFLGQRESLMRNSSSQAKTETNATLKVIKLLISDLKLLSWKETATSSSHKEPICLEKSLASEMSRT